MKHCPDCGAKAKKVMEKYQKHLGTTTLYRCPKCDEKWVLEYDEFEQRETIYRGIKEADSPS